MQKLWAEHYSMIYDKKNLKNKTKTSVTKKKKNPKYMIYEKN